MMLQHKGQTAQNGAVATLGICNSASPGQMRLFVSLKDIAVVQPLPVSILLIRQILSQELHSTQYSLSGETATCHPLLP